MSKLILLYSADLHATIPALLRIPTLIEQVRADHPDAEVIYLDAGDVQDKTNAISQNTLGAGLYHLLGVAGCQVGVMGNKCMKRYDVSAVQHWVKAGGFPVLVANVALANGKPIPATQNSIILKLNSMKLGVIGVTADRVVYISDLQLSTRPALICIREELAILRDQGADAVILLSHMGLDDDHRHALALQNDIPLIIGAHTHIELPFGKQVGKVWISHAGAYGEYLGQIEADWDGSQLTMNHISLLPISENIPPHPTMVEALETLGK
jgi:5'-nucleotidase